MREPVSQPRRGDALNRHSSRRKPNQALRPHHLLLLSLLLPLSLPRPTTSTSTSTHLPFDRSVLYKLYDTTSGDTWHSNRNWRDPKISICDWEGIKCLKTRHMQIEGHDEEIVESISLSDNNLSGEIPMTLLLQMPFLNTLELDGNPISFPQGIDEDDVLERNRGGIASSIKHLDLSRTDLQSLDGVFGREDGSGVMVELNDLTYVQLEECKLDGPFPVQLLKYGNLQQLLLDHNNFKGALPEQLAAFKHLRYLSLNGNSFGGSLPDFLGELSELQFLYLGDNAFTGPLPASLENLSELTSLDLSDQKLTGPLPSFSGLSKLRFLDLSSNGLEGPIPTDFLHSVYADSLQYVYLNSNKLTGTVPSQPFLKLQSEKLFLQDNRFDDVDEDLCYDRPFGCDSVLCKPGTFHPFGRKQMENDGCLTCPSAEFFGTVECDATEPPIEPPKVVKPPIPHETSREILMEFYQAMGGDGWTRKNNWNDETVSVCDWYGVHCFDPVNHVIGTIKLTDNNLKGEVPSSLFSLHSLTALTLANNPILIRFSGIEHAESLELLDLTSTGLTSVEGISNAVTLTELHLDSNALKGPVPDELFHLTNLQKLGLDRNELEGQLPLHIGKLVHLRLLSASKNKLEGKLPDSLVALKELASLSLDQNRFSGPLPLFLNQMQSLTYLDLSHQATGGFTGPLLDFANLVMLRHLDLNDNSLTGPIPYTFLSSVDVDRFEVANLSSNAIAGEIPATLKGLNALLMDNEITSIHDEVCMGNPNNEFGCNGILCPKHTWNRNGRQTDTDADTICEDCPTALYMGSTICPEEIAATQGIATEREILERFFTAMDGENWAEKEFWLEADTDHCKWKGIRCSPEGEITEITLRSNGLSGTVPGDIFNLSWLRILNLDGNSISVGFEEIEKATSLQSLDLSHTDLSSIKGLEKATGLVELYLTANALKGPFPQEALQLTNLKRISLAQNQLTGTIPPQISNLSQLEFISLHNNNLEGNLPPSIGSLNNLLFLLLQNNHFSGPIPQECMELTTLWFLDLSNQKDDKHDGLSGPLPSFSSFKELRRLDLKGNSFSGPVPSDLLQSVNPDFFEYVDLGSNQLSGTVPNVLLNVPVEGIYLADNLITDIDSELCSRTPPDYGCDAILCAPGTYNALGRQTNKDTECRSCPDLNGDSVFGSISCESHEVSEWVPPPVEVPVVSSTPMNERQILEKMYNDCGGDRWYRNDGWMDKATTHCQWFGIRCAETTSGLSVASIMLSSNNLVGTPPTELFRLANLDTLVLDDNTILFDFTDIEQAQKLQILELSSTGIVSLGGIGNARNLIELRLDENDLDGAIPDEMFTLVKLEQLSLDDNAFTGPLPPQINQLKKLKLLSISSNFLTGQLPTELGELQDLVTLHLQFNNLDGVLPTELGTLSSLSFLDLSHQTGLDKGGITGPLIDFREMRDLRRLDLSFNKLVGVIPPTFLKNTNPELLEVVDLRFNRLSGEVQKEVARLGILNLQENEFIGIDQEVCKLSSFGCDGILCPAQTCNCFGRQESESTPCEPCEAQFLGSTQCDGAATVEDSPSITSPPPPQPTPKPAPAPIVPPPKAPKIKLTERQILKKFFQDCKGLFWHYNDNWLSSPDICDWKGITCENDSVESISLGSNNVVGVPPFELFQLPNLKSLSLYGNPLDFSFRGIEYAAKLVKLELDATGLRSVNGIGEAPSLETVHLKYNQLVGDFPFELTKLTSLKHLSLSHNKLAGTLPAELDRLTNLKTLLLGSNRFVGVLSNARFPPSLKLLDLSQNELAGPIPPTFLNNLPSVALLEVDLSKNLLTGVIPSSLGNLNKLNIRLGDNFISGIDEELCAAADWNDGDVGKYGCDGLLCPVGHFAVLHGRQTSDGNACVPCSDAIYYGTTECDGVESSGRYGAGETVKMSWLVQGGMLFLTLALAVGSWMMD